MTISRYFVEFIFYSFLGWVWESIYCTAKEHKWQDRGFLFGPVCPIYGFCVTAGSILFGFVPSLSGPSLPLAAIFFISMAVSAVAEYGTSWVLEKRFHARWWDYSRLPLNIHGRICLPVTLAFGAGGVLIVKFLLPLMAETHRFIPEELYEALAIAFALLFGGDLALTEASLSELLSSVENFHQEFNTRAEDTYEKLQGAPHAAAESLQAIPARIQNSARNHIRDLSAGARYAMRNMTVFHAGGKIGEEGKSAGEHLKEAQAALENKIQKFTGKH